MLLGLLVAACGDDSSGSASDSDVLFPDVIATDSVEADTSGGDTVAADTTTPPICASTCTTLGARRCAAEVIEVCREQGECLVWQASSSCAAPLVCAQRQCPTADHTPTSHDGRTRYSADGTTWTALTPTTGLHGHPSWGRALRRGGRFRSRRAPQRHGRG